MVSKALILAIFARKYDLNEGNKFRRDREKVATVLAR